MKLDVSALLVLSRFLSLPHPLKKERNCFTSNSDVRVIFYAPVFSSLQAL